MQEFILINQEEVASILDMKTVIAAVEKAYSLKVSGQAELFPIVCHEFSGEDSEFDIKSGSVDGAGAFGMKLVSAFYGNDVYGLPRLMGTILIFDRKTGTLKGMMDGTLITNMRTGAAGGVGAKYLARPGSENLVVLGTGAQAMPLIEATLEALGNIKKITVVNVHNQGKAGAFAEAVRDKVGSGFEVCFAEDMAGLEVAVRSADVILTATPSKEAIIKSGWVKPGTHLSCIGSDMEGKQELDLELTGRAKLFADDVTQVVAVGECEKALKAGLVKAEDITEIGDVILGNKPGRTSDEDITIFDSTGIGLQDLMTASMVIDKAKEKGIGTLLKV